MIVSRILVWLVSLPLVLTLGIWIQVPFALSLKVPFSASSSITTSITQFPGSSQFLDKIFRPKNCVIDYSPSTLHNYNSCSGPTHQGNQHLDNGDADIYDESQESGPVLVPERQLCSWLNTGPLTSPTVVQDLATTLLWIPIYHGICQSRPEGTLCA